MQAQGRQSSYQTMFEQFIGNHLFLKFCAKIAEFSSKTMATTKKKETVLRELIISDLIHIINCDKVVREQGFLPPGAPLAQGSYWQGKRTNIGELSYIIFHNA